MDEPPIKVCAVCGRVLSHYGGEYLHTPTTPDDHPAVPVDEGMVPTVAKCDFCYAPDPDFVLPTRPFDAGMGMAFDGEWAACNECARLIRQNQWTRLWMHAKAAWEGRHGPMSPVMEQSLRGLHRQVRKNVLGDVRPLVRPGR